MLRLLLAGAVIASTGDLARAAENLEDLKIKLGGILHAHELPCTRMIAIRPLETADHYEVTCVESAGGSEPVLYIVNAWAAKVAKPGESGEGI
jgi:hypothetical protein